MVESRELLIIVLLLLPKLQPKVVWPPEIAAVFRRYLSPNFSPVVSVRYLVSPPLPFRHLPLDGQAELSWALAEVALFSCCCVGEGQSVHVVEEPFPFP